MALARYFSKKPWPNLEQPRPPADVAAVAKRVNTSVVCTSCHLEGFKGDSTQPRLAGQIRTYLEKTMKDFSTGARGNNPGMSGFMKGLTRSGNCRDGRLARRDVSLPRGGLFLSGKHRPDFGVRREIQGGLALFIF